MRLIKKSILLCVAMCLALPAMANHFANFYCVPSAGHTPGANNTQWVTDVAIANIQARPLTVYLDFIETGDDVSNNTAQVTSVVVPARGSVILSDVLKDFQGKTSVLGAMMVGADAAFALTARVYNTTEQVGLGVPVVRDCVDAVLGVTPNAGASAYIPGVISNAIYRENIGFLAGTANGAGPMTVRATVRDADGAAIGSREFTVPGGALKHVQVSVGSIASKQFDIGSVLLEIPAGNGAVFPYGVSVNNGNGDSAFFLSNFPPNTAPTALVTAPSSDGEDAVSNPFRDRFERLHPGILPAVD